MINIKYQNSYKVNCIMLEKLVRSDIFTTWLNKINLHIDATNDIIENKFDEVVHIDDEETITGKKSFSEAVTISKTNIGDNANTLSTNGSISIGDSTSSLTQKLSVNKNVNDLPVYTSLYVDNNGLSVLSNNNSSFVEFDSNELLYSVFDENNSKQQYDIYHSGLFDINDYVNETTITYPTIGGYTPENMQQCIDSLWGAISGPVIDIGALRYVGSVDSYDDLLLIEEPKCGDMYNVGGDAQSGNWAWNGTTWDSLGDTISLRAKAEDSEVVHLKGNEVINGVKTFNEFPLFKGVVPCDTRLGKNKLSIKTNAYIQLGEINSTVASGFMIVRQLTGDLYPQLANVTQRSKVEMSSTGGFKCSIMTAGKAMDEAHFMFDATRIIWYGSGTPGTSYPSSDWNKGYQLYHENIVPKMIDDISDKLEFPDINGEECTGLQDWINKVSALVNSLVPPPSDDEEPSEENPEEPTEEIPEEPSEETTPTE